MTRPGKLIVVGGHSRHVGKTSLVTALLKCLAPSEWVAVKISGHSHRRAPGALDARSAAQAARCLEAGARKAILLRAPDERFAEAAAAVRDMLDAGENVIAESNRLVGWCRPDMVFFVVAPAIPDWKPSSWTCLRAADAIVVLVGADLSGLSLAPLDDATLALPRFCLGPGHAETSALASWLRQRHGAGAVNHCSVAGNEFAQTHSRDNAMATINFPRLGSTSVPQDS